MSCNTLIGEWATGVWLFELGGPVNISALNISGFATSPSVLGAINSYIGTCYSGSGYSGPGTFDYDVVPDLTNTELALIDALYQVSYYSNLATSTMGYGGDSIPWTNVSEGDTKVARTNGATIGAVYTQQAKDAKAALNYMVNVYIEQVQAGNAPRDVEYPALTYPWYSSAFIGGR